MSELEKFQNWIVGLFSGCKGIIKDYEFELIQKRLHIMIDQEKKYREIAQREKEEIGDKMPFKPDEIQPYWLQEPWLMPPSHLPILTQTPAEPEALKLFNEVCNKSPLSKVQPVSDEEMQQNMRFGIEQLAEEERKKYAPS